MITISGTCSRSRDKAVTRAPCAIQARSSASLFHSRRATLMEDKHTGLGGNLKLAPAATRRSPASGSLLTRDRCGRERRRRDHWEPEMLPRPVQRVVDIAVHVLLAQLVVEPRPLERHHGLGVYV
jgi:hypothetical protein